MTIDDAIRILDPATTREALRPYDYDAYKQRQVVDEACRVAVDELRKQQNNGWISVKDRLPEDDTMQLVVAKAKNGNRSINRAWHDRQGWHGSGSMAGVTHWRPLPELPEDDQQ